MKILRAISVLLILTLLLPCSGTAEKKSEEEKLKLRKSYTHVVKILDKEYVVFAQNSPEWYDLYADDNKDSTRQFGSSACIVTSFANVLVNSLPYDELRLIEGAMQEPPQIDTRGITRRNGRTTGRFAITEKCDYFRFWPVIVGNYAAGNNLKHSYTPMRPAFYHYLTEYFGLEMEVYTDFKKSFDLLDEGAMIITCSSGSTSPFSKVGHYFAIVARDDEYIYILDSYFRDYFPLDRRKIVEYIEPGVERIKISDLSKMQIETQYVIWPKENATVYNSKLFDDIMEESDYGID